MISFKTYYKNLLSENALPWKEVPEEERNKAYEMIKKHNDSVVEGESKIKGFYIIDVTGKYQVYYTFWRFREIDPRIKNYIKNPIYFGNLTTNLLSSIEKALSNPVVRNVRVELLTDETRQGMIGKSTKTTPSFTFGKYRGKTFPEVYLEDPSYFAFLAKNADPRYETSKTNLAIKAFANMYFDDVTKKNQETSTSQYVGNVGDNYQGELELYNIKNVPARDSYSDGYTVFKLKDDEGNKFMTYRYINTDIGSKLKIKGKIKGFKEILGVKFTRLSNIKAI